MTYRRFPARHRRSRRPRLPGWPASGIPPAWPRLVGVCSPVECGCLFLCPAHRLGRAVPRSVPVRTDALIGLIRRAAADDDEKGGA